MGKIELYYQVLPLWGRVYMGTHINGLHPIYIYIYIYNCIQASRPKNKMRGIKCFEKIWVENGRAC